MSEYITCRCQAYISIIVVAWDRSQAYKFTFLLGHDWRMVVRDMQPFGVIIGHKSQILLCFILAKRNARLYMHVFFHVTVILKVWNITSSQWVGNCDVKKCLFFGCKARYLCYQMSDEGLENDFFQVKSRLYKTKSHRTKLIACPMHF